MAKKTAPKTVRLYPTGLAFIHTFPTTELEVSPELADELLKYHPAVYSTEPTGWPPALVMVGENGPELVVPPPPSEATPDIPTAPENPGPSDSSAKE